MKSFYELEEYALVKDVPIMQKEGIEYLIDELNKRNAESVLEIGSAIGYSSLMMATHVKGLHVLLMQQKRSISVSLRSMFLI